MTAKFLFQDIPCEFYSKFELGKALYPSIGIYSTTYEVKNRFTQQKLMLKIIDKRLAGAMKIAEIMEIAQKLLNCEFQNIVPIKHIFQTSDKILLISDYFKMNIYEKKFKTENEICEILLQLCDLLKFMDNNKMRFCAFRKSNFIFLDKNIKLDYFNYCGLENCEFCKKSKKFIEDEPENIKKSIKIIGFLLCELNNGKIVFFINLYQKIYRKSKIKSKFMEIFILILRN